MSRKRGLAVTHFRFGGERYFVLGQDLPQADALASLTPAELRIALAVLDGRSTAAIASELDRSPRTIANHIAAIFRKLGVGSRGELAARFRTM